MREYAITCDGGCFDAIEDDKSMGRAETTAAERGWVVSKGRDLCPACVEEGAEEAAWIAAGRPDDPDWEPLSQTDHIDG